MVAVNPECRGGAPDKLLKIARKCPGDGRFGKLGGIREKGGRMVGDDYRGAREGFGKTVGEPGQALPVAFHHILP